MILWKFCEEFGRVFLVNTSDTVFFFLADQCSLQPKNNLFLGVMVKLGGNHKIVSSCVVMEIRWDLDVLYDFICLIWPNVSYDSLKEKEDNLNMHFSLFVKITNVSLTNFFTRKKLFKIIIKATEMASDIAANLIKFKQEASHRLHPAYF